MTQRRKTTKRKSTSKTTENIQDSISVADKTHEDQQETTSVVGVVVEDVEVIKNDLQEPTNNTDLLVPLFITLDSDQNRLHVADLIYVYALKEIKLQTYAQNYEAQVEGAILGDASIRDEKTGQITMISREEEPEKWVRNLCYSLEFQGNPFIATEAEEKE